MFFLDLLPSTPEKFLDCFWPEGDRIVFSSAGAGRNGHYVTEPVAKSAFQQYFFRYEAATRQLKWALRGLALVLALILFAYRGNFTIGVVFAILMLIFLMLLAILAANVSLALLRSTLTRKLAQGASCAGLSRTERVERGYAFGFGAMIVFALVVAAFAGLSFVGTSGLLRFEPGLSHWIGPAIFAGYAIWQLIKRQIRSND